MEHGGLIVHADDPIRLYGTSASSEGDSSDYTQHSRRVLVVDDERLLADSTAAVLRGAGFSAKTAYDGWEALELIQSFKPTYLLTDVVMPRMNGVQLAITVSKMFPAIKVMLFSGQVGISGILEESYEKGYEFPLLAKPIHPLKLIESLKALDIS